MLANKADFSSDVSWGLVGSSVNLVKPLTSALLKLLCLVRDRVLYSLLELLQIDRELILSARHNCRCEEVEVDKKEITLDARSVSI